MYHSCNDVLNYILFTNQDNMLQCAYLTTGQMLHPSLTYNTISILNKYWGQVVPGVTKRQICLKRSQSAVSWLDKISVDFFYCYLPLAFWHIPSPSTQTSPPLPTKGLKNNWKFKYAFFAVFMHFKKIEKKCKKNNPSSTPTPPTIGLNYGWIEKCCFHRFIWSEKP